MSMKKNYVLFLIFITVITVGIFIAFKVITQPPTPTENTDPVADQVVTLPDPVSKNILIKNETREIDIEYPFFNTPSVDGLILKKIKDIESSFNEMADQMDIGIMTNVPLISVDYTVKRSGNTVSVIIKGYQDTGGAHPIPFIITLVFTNGQLVTLDEYFTVPSTEYLARFQFIARKALIDKYGAESLFLEGLDPTPESWANWYVVDNAFVVIFSPYQVGPYVIGMPEVIIPFSQVQDILQQ